MSSLYRWSRDTKEIGPPEDVAELRLVEAVTEPVTAPTAERSWAYEVTSTRGTLRVRDAVDESTLRVVLDAVLGKGGR